MRITYSEFFTNTYDVGGDSSYDQVESVQPIYITSDKYESDMNDRIVFEKNNNNIQQEIDSIYMRIGLITLVSIGMSVGILKMKK
jgi:hypothetical protein